jgi:hypothetical protein
VRVSLQLVFIGSGCSCVEKDPVKEVSQLSPSDLINPCTMEPFTNVVLCVYYLAFYIVEQGFSLFESL